MEEQLTLPVDLCVKIHYKYLAFATGLSLHFWAIDSCAAQLVFFDF